MIPLMLNGTYNPGQLVAVREIMDGTPDAPGRADSFDTAVFQGNSSEYSIITNDGVRHSTSPMTSSRLSTTARRRAMGPIT